MDKLAAIEDICKNLHGFKDEEELITQIYSLHLMLMKYFLGIEDIEGRMEISIAVRLKEIAFFLFEMASNDLLNSDISPKTCKDLLAISTNIFEQLCKYFKLYYEYCRAEYYEFILVCVACLSISGNIAKAYVVFQRYFKDICKQEDEVDFLFQVIIAFFAKDYIFINLNDIKIKDICIQESKLEDGSLRILSQIVLNILSIIDFFENGNELILSTSINSLKELLAEAISDSLYKEIWLIKNVLKNVEISVEHSMWKVLRNKISERAIDALIHGKDKPTYELWEHQKEIVENGLLDIRYNNIIHMPTSSGKSLIAQMAILKVLTEYEDATCIYIVPTNALLSQVKNDLYQILEKINISIDILITGYDAINLETDKLDSSRLIILTQEKLDSLIRKNDKFIDRCKLFIFDEFHNVSEGSRGLLLEFVVSKIKLLGLGNEPKLLFLAAVLPNIMAFKKWIGDEQTTVFSSHDCRPTRQNKVISYYRTELVQQKNSYDAELGKYKETILQGFRIYYQDQINRSIYADDFLLAPQNRIFNKKSCEYKTQDFCANTAELFARIGNVLVYLPDSTWFGRFCESMGCKHIDVSSEEVRKLEQISEHLSVVLGKDHILTTSVKKGFAYHHKKMPDSVKRIIEGAFKDGTIKVLACTTTLAQGLNFPISTIVVGALRAGGKKLSKAEFQNLIGRAGRAMFETEGYIVVGVKVKGSYKKEKLYSWNECNEYLFPEDDKFELHSVLEELISTLNDQQSEIDSKFDELIRLYEAFIFDLEQNNHLETEEDYNKLIDTLFCSQNIQEQGKELFAAYTRNVTTNLRTKLNAIEHSLVKKALKESGLSIDSSLKLYNAVNEFLVRGVDFVFENYRLNEGFIEIFRVINEIPEFRIGYDPLFFYSCLNDWINLKSHNEIASSYFQDDLDKCISFINENISYRAAWFLSVVFQTFQALLLSNLGCSTQLEAMFSFDEGVLSKISLLENFSLLAGYCKFGVNEPCFFRIIDSGLYERELLIKAHNLFVNHTSIRLKDENTFYFWVHHVSLVEIKSSDIKISNYERSLWGNYKKDIAQFVENFRCSEDFVKIKGYGLYKKKSFQVGEPLWLKHDESNSFDNFAMEIYAADDIKIGYLDRNYSETVFNLINEDGENVWAFFAGYSDDYPICKIISRIEL